MRLALLVLLGCGSKSSEPVAGSGSAARDATVAIVVDAAPVADAADRLEDIASKNAFADPFQSDPFEATSISGTTLRDGKLVDVATLEPKIIFRACPSDVASGGWAYIVDRDHDHLLDIHLGGELEPKQRVKLFAEDDTHQHHGPSYASVELPDHTEARKGFVVAHTYSKSRVDIEVDADFGPKGHIKMRFTHGPPRPDRFGVGSSCKVN